VRCRHLPTDRLLRDRGDYERRVAGPDRRNRVGGVRLREDALGRLAQVVRVRVVDRSDRPRRAIVAVGVDVVDRELAQARGEQVGRGGLQIGFEPVGSLSEPVDRVREVPDLRVEGRRRVERCRVDRGLAVDRCRPHRELHAGHALAGVRPVEHGYRADLARVPDVGPAAGGHVPRRRVLSAVFPVALAAPLADRHDANRLAAAHGTLLGLRVERDPVDRAGLVLGERLPRHRERVPDGPVGEPL